MRQIGFSSGALAKGDFRRGIELQQRRRCVTAIELSALRDHELLPLLAAIDTLDLKSFAYVSFHAPSRLGTISERDLVNALRQLPTHFPIVVHPDVIRTISWWKEFRDRVCIENMDNRKTTGRTVSELAAIFDALPEAGFCFDIGHARQIDPTMAVALHMAKQFARRLRQLHVSEVGPRGEHLPLSILAKEAFRRVLKFVRTDVPVILEAMVAPDRIDAEVRSTMELFEPVAAPVG